MGVSQTLRRFTEGTTYVRHGDNHVGHWPTLIVFVFLFVFCTVTDFSEAEIARGVTFCMHVGLLSGQVFFPFGEYWIADSHAGGGISRYRNRRAGVDAWVHRSTSSDTCGEGRWAFGIAGGGVA